MELQSGLPHFFQFHLRKDVGIEFPESLVQLVELFPVHIVHIGIAHGGALDEPLEMGCVFLVFFCQCHGSDLLPYQAGSRLPLAFFSIQSFTGWLWKIFTNFW